MIVTETPAVRQALELVTRARVDLRLAVSMYDAEQRKAGIACGATVRYVERSERARDTARADLERAVRAANPSAAEAELQAAVRAL